MENTCSQYLFLFLLSLSTSPPPPVEASIDRLRWLHRHSIGKKWDDANNYCKSHYGGNSTLANARNDLDLSYFSEICGGYDDRCWVGLRNQGMCGLIHQDRLFNELCGKTFWYLCEHNLALEEEKTWEEALDHCRALEPDASDLLSFHDEEELSHVQGEMTRVLTEEVWIGLRWLAGRWLWMDRNAGGVITLPECPADGNHCGTLSGGGQQARNCVEKRRFVTISNGRAGSDSVIGRALGGVGITCNLVFVEEKKTWEEALDHCRALGRDKSKRMDLLSFHDEEELSYTREMMTWAQTEEVWIGLRWLAGRWLWMDRNAGGVITLPECPANGNHCGTLSGGGQQPRNCLEKRRFFCLKYTY
ncbi:unnamed protein product [Gadus morhua 'NCC']